MFCFAFWLKKIIIGESPINGIVLTKMKTVLAFALLHVITQLGHLKEVIFKKYICFPPNNNNSRV